MALRNYLGIIICFLGNLAHAQIPFQNVTERAGIKQVHTTPVYMGGGVTFFDYNNDGFDDIFLTGGVKPDKLYKNLGDFEFEDVTDKTGLFRFDRNHSNGAVAGDINNDGFEDLFIVYGIGERNRLYLNVEGKRFTEITESSGLMNLAWSMGATFGDINLDGLLDLYVINWVEKFKSLKDEQGHPIGFNHTGYSNNLYLNNGDNTFTDITSAYQADNKGCSLAVLMTDFNSDSYPDIYIANDFGKWVMPNALLKNEFPQQIFSNVGQQQGLDAAIYGMGIAAGDYDRNGFIDYYVTNIGRNVLFKNTGTTYLDVTYEANVENDKVNGLNTTGWGTVFADLDNDGFEDLLVSNGYINAASFLATSPKDPNRFFLNNHDGTFSDLSDQYGLNDPNISRGVAVSDLDNDGDLDILFTYIDTDISDAPSTGNVLLYRNNSSNSNHYLKLKLEGKECNRDAYNARITLFRDHESWIRELYSGSSHNSQNSSIIHFGLGEVIQIDSMEIKWPGGDRQMIFNLEADHNYFVKQGNPEALLLGCTNPSSMNYDVKADISFGCLAPVVTAVNDTRQDNSSFIYPNPCGGKLNYYIPATNHGLTGHIEIISMDGRIVKTEEIYHSGKIITIDISHLKTGIYLFKGVNDMFRFFKK